MARAASARDLAELASGKASARDRREAGKTTVHTKKGKRKMTTKARKRKRR